MQPIHTGVRLTQSESSKHLQIMELLLFRMSEYSSGKLSLPISEAITSYSAMRIATSKTQCTLATSSK